MSAESIEHTVPETQIAEPEPGSEMPPSETLPSLETSTFSPYFDIALYTKLFPDKTPEQAAQIIPILNNHIAESTQSKPSANLTYSETQRFTQERAQFYKYMGWSRPDNPMNTWYRGILSRHKYDLQPGAVVQNIRFIDALYGDRELTDHVHRFRWLMVGCSLTSLQKSYNHSTRLGSVFGLDEPAVRDAIRQRPELLAISSEMRYFCLRAMADHGEKLGVRSTSQIRPYSIMASWPAQKILGRIAGFKADLRRPQSRKHETANNFLRGLNAPGRQQIVGRNVLHAYFRNDPVKNPELLVKNYPHLQRFNMPTMREWEAQRALPSIPEIKPDSPWLQIAALSVKEIDFEALNRSAVKASKKIQNAPFGREAFDRAAILQKTRAARKDFVMEMGWYDPSHALYKYACRVEKDEKLSWPSPTRIIDVITVVSKYTADPLCCIKGVAGYVFDTNPESLEQKLVAITEAFPGIPDIKMVASKNLSRSIAVIRENGARYEQKRAAKSAQE